MGQTVNDEFIQRLEASGLISEKMLSRVKDRISDSTSTRKLVGKLVNAGALTRWQGNQFLKGREKFLQIGRYQLKDCLATHSRAAVYQALDTESGEHVRLDIIQGALSGDHPAPRRPISQFRKAQGVKHPGIGRLIDYYEKDGYGTLVSEYLAGPSDDSTESGDQNGKSHIQHAIAAKELLGKRRRVAKLVRELAVALSHAHEQHIYDDHLTPNSIWLNPNGPSKIILMGVHTVREKNETWDDLDPLSDEDNSYSDGAAIAVCRDIRRLGRLGLFYLTGEPKFAEGSEPASRLEALLRTFTSSSPGEGVESMHGVVKQITRWERASKKRDGNEREDADQLLSDMDSIADDPANIVIQVGGSDSQDFELGPKQDANNDEDDSSPANLERRRAMKIPPVAILSIAGVAAVIIIVATIAIVISVLGQDPNEVANNDNGSEQTVSRDSEAIEETDDGQSTSLTNGGGIQSLIGDGTQNASGTNAGGNQSGGADNGQTANENENVGNQNEPNVAANDDQATQDDANADTDDAAAGNNEEDVAVDSNDADNNQTQVADNGSTDAEPMGTENGDDDEAESNPIPKLAFEEIPDYFGLPEFGTRDEPSDDFAAPISIGNIYLRPDDLFFVDLLGGDSSQRGRIEFKLTIEDESPTSFRGSISMHNRDEVTPVAQIWIEESLLNFQWDENADSQPTIANFCNCLFVFRTGTETKPVRMRQPVTIDPIKLNDGNAGGQIVLELANLPRTDRVKVEVLPGAGDFPNFQFRENEYAVNAGNGTVFFDFAPFEGASFVGKLESSLRSRLTLNYSTFVMDGRRPQSFSQTILDNQIGQARAALEAVEAEIGRLSQLQGQQRQQAQPLLQARQATQAELVATINSLTAVSNRASTFRDHEVTVRVYLDLDEYQVDLATPDGKPTQPEE